MKRPALLALLLSIPLFLTAACTLTGGGGTDVGNPEMTARVSGSLKHRDGSPAPFIPIHLRPEAFLTNPDSLPVQEGKKIQDGFSDTQGFFTFDSVPVGEYRIEAMDSISHGAVLDIVADGKTELMEIGPMILDSTGSIAGRINYVRPIKNGYPKIIIAVYGSDRWTAATLDGQFMLSDLPPGKYKLHVSTNTDSDTTFTAEFPETELHAGERDSVGSVDLGR
jgi:hypothetical protein